MTADKSPDATNASRAATSTERPQPTFEEERWDQIEVSLRPFVYTLIVLTACCARRIRSEALLKSCVSEYLGRMMPPRTPRGIGDDMEDFLNANRDRKWAIFDDSKKTIVLFKNTSLPGGRQAWVALRKETGADQQHLNDKTIPELEDLVLKCIYELAGYGKQSVPSPSTKIGENRRWLYRAEGAYYWMHRDVRDDVYRAIKRGKNYHQLAMAHHIIALFCYDELYERSRDSRAFLEYLFHRIASIRLACDAKQPISALRWVTRLLIALHREKHALLTRVRLPGFMRQLSELKAAINLLGKWQLQKILPKGRLVKLENDKFFIDVNERLSDLLQIEADFLLASGNPRSAFANHCERLNQDVSCQPPGLKALDELKNKAQKELDRIVQRKKQRIDIQKDLTVYGDLAYACHDPLLSPIPFPSVQSASDRPDWAPELQKADDWLELMVGSGLTAGIRSSRLALCKLLYQKLAEVRLARYSDMDKLSPWTDHDEHMDFFAGLVRKVCEFRLLYQPQIWIDSSKAYLEDDTRLHKELATWRERVVKEKLPDKWDLTGERPLLRRTGKRLRHECYRLCQLARLQAAEHLEIETASEVFERLLALRGENDWKKIRRLLADAESVVDRAGGPADRQATSISRLIAAELLVRRGEMLIWAFRTAGFIRDEKAKLKSACEKSLVEALSMLSTVDRLMNEGRGENRWRFFYLLTRGRAHLLSAFLQHESAQHSALQDMRQAAMHLTGALNNCGLWTDRYDVLLWWWDTWRAVAGLMIKNPDELEVYLSEMYARLGVRWGSEEYACRFDRYYPVGK